MDEETEILYAYDITPETETAQAVVQSNIVPQYIPIILDTALSNIDKINISVTDSIMFVIQSEFDTYKQAVKTTFNTYKQEVQKKLDTKQDKGDYVIKQTFDTELAKKSDKTHNHNSIYSLLSHVHNFITPVTNKVIKSEFDVPLGITFRHVPLSEINGGKNQYYEQLKGKISKYSKYNIHITIKNTAPATIVDILFVHKENVYYDMYYRVLSDAYKNQIEETGGSTIPDAATLGYWHKITYN